MTLLFILLQSPEPAKDLATIINPVMSALALILSSCAFIFSVFIQLKERKRNIRLTLSTSLSDIAAINVEVFRIRKEEKEISSEFISMIDNYNAQRGTLVSAADFLMGQNEKLASDVDCSLMARTYDDIGNIEKAEEYWREAIARASSPAQKHVHERNYAAFLFNNNKVEKGRKHFERAVHISMPGTDDELGYMSATYLIWAGLEHNFDNEPEAERLLKEADYASKQIKNFKKNTEAVTRLKKTSKELFPVKK